VSHTALSEHASQKPSWSALKASANPVMLQPAPAFELVDLQRRTVRIHIGKSDSWVVLPLHPEFVGLANYFWTRKCRPAAATGSRPMRHCAASNCQCRRYSRTDRLRGIREPD
jgi:hypothetical protein